MKKNQKKAHKELREELVKRANETNFLSENTLRSLSSKKRKSTINRIRYKIANLSIEPGDI